MSPSFFSQSPSESGPPAERDPLAREFTSIVKQPKHATLRLEAAVEVFCSGFLPEEYSGDCSHPKLNTVSNYIRESETAHPPFSDLYDRFGKARRIIRYTIAAQLGTREAATLALTIVNDSLLPTMGTCLLEKNMSAMIDTKLSELLTEHVSPFLLRTETAVENPDSLVISTPLSTVESNDPQTPGIGEWAASAEEVKRRIDLWADLFHRQFPSLVADVVGTLKYLAPEMPCHCSDDIKRALIESFEPRFLTRLRGLVQEQSAVVNSRMTAIKRVLSPDLIASDS